MKKANNLEKYVIGEVKAVLSNKPKPKRKVEDIDFHTVTHSSFNHIIPINSVDREERMNRIKSKMNLSFLQNVDRRTIIQNKRIGSERDGMVFNKIHPIYNIDPQSRPNSFEWVPEEMDRKLINKIVKEKEEQEKSEKRIQEIAIEIEEKSQKLH